MVINLDKTKYMLIATPQKKSRTDKDLNIVFNDDALSTMSNKKVLGVQIDYNLS